MSSSDYHDQSAGRAMLAEALKAAGWAVYGYSADASDMMTDYYQPATWNGVAEKRGALVVADARAEDSGGRERVRYVAGETCPECKGERVEAGAPNLMEARAGGGVVSPIPYFDGCHNSPPTPEGRPDLRGKRVCNGCGGRGTMLRAEIYVEPWPQFQVNPPRRQWHVERGGVILASGVGLGAVGEEKYHQRHEYVTPTDDHWAEVTCSACGKQGPHGEMHREECPQARPKLRALLARIEAAASGAPRASGNGPSAAPEPGAWAIGPGKRPGYVEIRFGVKPADEIRASLKGAGFRWAKSGGCWYGLASRLPARLHRVAVSTFEAGGRPLPEDRDELRDPGEDAADRWNEVNR